MIHDGLRKNRLQGAPLEQTFADEWKSMNKATVNNSLLDWLLAKDPSHPKGEVSQRDATVAATIIQWLGTPVGQGFLRRVEERSL